MDHSIRTARRRWRTKVVWTLAVTGVLLGAPVVGQGQTSAALAGGTPAPSGVGVEAIAGIGQASLAVAGAKPATTKTTTATVDGAQWVDSGVVVTAGERLGLQASGTMSLGDGRSVGPAGLDRGWKDLLRQFPLNTGNAGMLIGRVGADMASVPMAIGASATMTMPTAGELFLRTNVSSDLAPATGSFRVVVRPEAATAAASGKTIGAAAPPVPVSTLVSPGLFAGVPRRVADQTGDPGDMVNFAIVGSAAEVQAAFKNAGWVAVDKTTGDAVLHGLLATLGHQAYVEMPMSTLYLFGRPQDLSFARADPLTVAAERHHLRVWKTTEMVAGEPVWVGSATHDIGFERDQRNGGTTHKIDPDIDLERGFLLNSFNAAGDLASAAYVTPADPLREARTATGGSFHSDGRVLVMDLAPGLQ